jgi:hypothetical protein
MCLRCSNDVYNSDRCILVIVIMWSRDSAVNTAIYYGTDDSEVEVLVPARAKNSLFSMPSRRPLEKFQSPLKFVQGIPSPGLNRPGRKVDHSRPASAEVQKTCIYTPTFLYVIMA